MNEEFEKRWERHVEFFLQQHAKSETRMDRLEAAQAETQKKLDRAAEILSNFTAVSLEWCKVLSESHKVTEEALQKLTDRMDRHRRDDHGLEN